MHPQLLPPYLFLSDFFLFPRMKKVLKGKRFTDVDKVKQKMAKTLKGIKIDEFKSCFEQWENIWIGIVHQMERTWKVTEV